MKQLVIEQAAALVSTTGTEVVLLSLGMDFGEMTGMQARDLADLRPIIGHDVFETLCSRQHVMLTGDPRGPDGEQMRWMAEALVRIVPNCGAPVAALHFAGGTLMRLVSSVNHSLPSGIDTHPEARKAA